MRPIKLEIAGLQSFIEKQTIDFSAAENGVFGIFGKTGSGKSTILDGITLALYGYVTRINKNAEFINSKCNKAEVSLDFESDGKIYRVIREFKLKKNNKEVDSYASLELIENGNVTLLAEGSFQTDKKIEEIIGLTATEFCQVIALPQGKFAEFLHAKPAERTALISNIFGITEYAEKLYNNVKNKLSTVENELNMLEAEKEGVGIVSHEDINAKQEQFESQDKKLKELNIELENLNKEYLSIVENSSLKKDQIRLKSELEELYKQSGVIKDDKTTLQKMEDAKKLEIYFSAMERLQSQLTQLNDDVNVLKKEKQDQEMFFRDYEEQYKKFEAMHKSALIDLDTKRLKLIELSEDKYLVSSLKQEKEKLQKQLTEKTKKINEEESKLKELENKLSSIEKELIKLKADKLELENQKANLDIVTENKSIESEIMLILELEKQIERVIDDYKEELNSIKIDYSNIYKKEREQSQRIAEITNALDKVLGKSDKLNIERFRDIVVKLSSMDNVQDKYEFLRLLNEKTKAETIKLIESSKLLEDQIEKVKTSLQEKIQITNKYESELKNAQIQREEFLGENGLSLLVQNVDIGDNCPVCKNRVSVKNIVPLSDLSGRDAEIAAIRNTLSIARKDKENEAAKLATLTAQLQFIKAQITINKSKFDSIKEAQDKLYMQFVDKNDKQLENFKNLHEATYASSVALEKLLIEKDKLFNASLEIIEERVECGAKIQSINEYIARMTDVLYAFEKARAEREFAIYNFENVAGVDYRAAAKQLNNIIENLDNIIQEIDVLEKEKSLLIDKKFEIANTNNYLLSEQSELKIKLENIETQISQKENNFKQLGFDMAEADPLDQINKKQEELKAKSNEFLESYNYKLEQKQKSEKDYQLKLALLNDKNEELRETEAKLYNNARVNGFESKEDAKKYIASESDINNLREKVTEFEKKVSLVNMQLTSINEKLGTTEVDISYCDELKEKIDTLKVKISEDQVCFGVLQAELSELKNKKSKLDELDKKLPELKTKYDLAKELYMLLRGKSLAEFMANEYVDMIIDFANQKLRILDGGRYKLYYDNKDFYVEDNLNNGSSRIVSTLSGGETFLVSLSLALAISDVISMQSEKKIDFFFLDEGFGTLDSDLCATVVQALFRLKGANLNIGIISHVQELQNALQYKFIVTKANENTGSRVRLETGL